MIGKSPIRRSPFAPAALGPAPARDTAPRLTTNIFARQEPRTRQDRPLLSAGWRIDP